MILRPDLAKVGAEIRVWSVCTNSLPRRSLHFVSMEKHHVKGKWLPRHGHASDNKIDEVRVGYEQIECLREIVPPVGVP